MNSVQSLLVNNLKIEEQLQIMLFLMDPIFNYILDLLDNFIDFTADKAEVMIFCFSIVYFDFCIQLSYLKIM